MDGISRAVTKGTLVFALSVCGFMIAAASPPSVPIAPGALLNTWLFDGTNLVTTKGTLPRGVYGVELAPSWQNNAASVAGTSALLQYNEIDTNGVTNIVCDNGTVTFWFSPQWDSGVGPGVYGRLLEMGQYTTDAAFGWWSIYVDASGSWLYFGAQTNGAGSNILTAPISWQSNTWHHVALTYTPTNSALYVDGQLATNGGGVVHYPGPGIRWTNGLAIGSDTSGDNVANGRFDWMQTYSYPVAGNTISNSYEQTVQTHPELSGGGGDFLNAGPGNGWFDDPMLMDGGESGGAQGAESSQALTLVLQPAGADVRLILYGSVPGTVYSIYSKPNLSSAPWTFEKNVTGAADQGWTDTFIPINGRQMLFLRAGSTDDADGDGLSDAEELFITGTDPENPDTGNTGIADGYKDPDLDGWTNIDEIRNSTNPNGWNAPPAPFGLVILHNNPSSGEITIDWEPAPGAVTGYLLKRTTSSGEEDIARLPADTSFLETLTPDLSFVYRVKALYGSYASSSWSAPVAYADPVKGIDAAIVRGPLGKLYLICSAFPPNVARVRVHRTMMYQSYPDIRLFGQGAGGLEFIANVEDGDFEVPIESFVEGVFRIPDAEAPPYGHYSFTVQTLGANDEPGPLLQTTPVFPATRALNQEGATIPFLDGRVALLENLKFQLRAARADQPLQLYIAYPDIYADYLATHAYGRDRVAVGFQNYLPEDPSRPAYIILNEFAPFEENHLYSNFVFNVSEIGPYGDLLTTAYPHVLGNEEGIRIEDGIRIPAPKYYFDANAFIQSGSSSPGVLPFPASRWIMSVQSISRPSIDTEWMPLIGLAEVAMPNAIGRITVSAGSQNIYGLPFTGCKIVYPEADPEIYELSGGSYVDIPRWYHRDFYPEVAMPVFQLERFEFMKADALMPCHPDYVPQPVQAPIIASVGKPIGVAGWAKLTLQNGDPTKQIYLQQYFDKAYKANPDGTRSTTETGILSEYGEFFPTEPGRVILTTKPDLDTGAVGECTVHVIGIGLDANHDGDMDLKFSGPDHTSEAHPFRFWVNNDIDDGHIVDGTDFEEDDLRPSDITEATRRRSADHEFKSQVTIGGSPPIYVPSVPCKRDLEDYARLWLPGLTAMFASLPANYTVELRAVGEGEINLFQATEPDGGTGYLTEESVAQNQVQNSVFLYRGKVSSAAPVRLSGVAGMTDYFVFCGAKRGALRVILEVKDDNQRVTSDTSAFVQLLDIKEMYERWTVNDVTVKGRMVEPVSEARPAVEGLPQGASSAFQYPYSSQQDASTPYIVFVHGWNMPLWEKDRFAETAFKRLYWQGYQGRFGSFRWPTDFDFEGTLWDAGFQAQHFDRSEFNAWKSGESLRRFLSTLNSKYPGNVFVMAHSMGNIVIGEALRSAGNTTLINTYVASQAALSAHLYNSALNAPLSWNYDHPQIPGGAQDYGPSTPNVYGGWLAANGAAALRRVNFYNPNDWALAAPNWQFNQIFKPADGINHGLFTYRYGFWGTPYGAFESYTPGSVDDVVPWRGFAKIALVDNISLDIQTDRYEIMSFASEARCKALGALAVGTFADVNLADPNEAIWPPDGQDPPTSAYSRHKWHSAQFRSTSMRQKDYWAAILGNRGFRIQ